MKRKSNAGFSLVETLVAIALLAGIVIPICSSLVLSVRMNAKAGDVLRAQLAVSSAVETLMAEGITHASDTYDVQGSVDRFPDAGVVTTQNADASYYNVEVTSTDGLVTVTTCIRAAQPPADGEGEPE